MFFGDVYLIVGNAYSFFYEACVCDVSRTGEIIVRQHSKIEFEKSLHSESMLGWHVRRGPLHRLYGEDVSAWAKKNGK